MFSFMTKVNENIHNLHGARAWKIHSERGIMVESVEIRSSVVSRSKSSGLTLGHGLGLRGTFPDSVAAPKGEPCQRPPDQNQTKLPP